MITIILKFIIKNIELVNATGTLPVALMLTSTIITDLHTAISIVSNVILVFVSCKYGTYIIAITVESEKFFFFLVESRCLAHDAVLDEKMKAFGVVVVIIMVQE